MNGWQCRGLWVKVEFSLGGSGSSSGSAQKEVVLCEDHNHGDQVQKEMLSPSAMTKGKAVCGAFWETVQSRLGESTGAGEVEGRVSRHLVKWNSSSYPEIPDAYGVNMPSMFQKHFIWVY